MNFKLSVQIFAIQLLSQLCTQYALPKSLSVARLAISVMGTLLTGEWRSFTRESARLRVRNQRRPSSQC